MKFFVAVAQVVLLSTFIGTTLPGNLERMNNRRSESTDGDLRGEQFDREVLSVSTDVYCPVPNPMCYKFIITMNSFLNPNRKKPNGKGKGYPTRHNGIRYKNISISRCYPERETGPAIDLTHLNVDDFTVRQNVTLRGDIKIRRWINNFRVQILLYDDEHPIPKGRIPCTGDEVYCGIIEGCDMLSSIPLPPEIVPNCPMRPNFFDVDGQTFAVEEDPFEYARLEAKPYYGIIRFVSKYLLSCYIVRFERDMD